MLTVNIAKPMKIKLGSHKPVWAEADDWYKNQLKEGGQDDGGEVKDDDGGEMQDSRGSAIP